MRRSSWIKGSRFDKAGYKMVPLFAIKDKVRTCVEQASFFQFRYDETEFVDDGTIFCIKYASILSFLVTTCGKKLGREFIIRITNKLDNED